MGTRAADPNDGLGQIAKKAAADVLRRARTDTGGHGYLVLVVAYRMAKPGEEGGEIRTGMATNLDYHGNPETIRAHAALAHMAHDNLLATAAELEHANTLPRA